MLCLKGHDVPNPIRCFDDLIAVGIHPKIVAQIKGFGFDEVSPIQVGFVGICLRTTLALNIVPVGTSNSDYGGRPRYFWNCTNRSVNLNCMFHVSTTGDFYCHCAGSGKTLAFSIPLIAALKGPAAKGFRAAIVSPTRELAVQIKREFDRVAAGTKLQIRLLDKSTASVNSFGVSLPSAAVFDELHVTKSLFLLPRPRHRGSSTS